MITKQLLAHVNMIRTIQIGRKYLIESRKNRKINVFYIIRTYDIFHSD